MSLFIRALLGIGEPSMLERDLYRIGFQLRWLTVAVLMGAGVFLWGISYLAQGGH